MDKILISSLNKYVQNAILNNQQKFNPDLDAYIDETEIGELLNYFGAKDIKELQDTGLDTFKSETEKQETDEVPEDIIPEEAENEEKTPAEETNTVLNIVKRDNASNKLIISDASSVSLRSSDNTLNTIYESAGSNDQLQYFIEDVASEVQKIEDELKENEMTEESKYTYIDNKGNKRTIDVKQSISMGGIVNKEKSLNKQVDSEEDNDNSENVEAPQDMYENNLDGGIRYTLLAETDNTKFGFKANVENTDQDFFTYLKYDKTIKNGGEFKLTGSGRITLDQNSFLGSGGLAVDYKNKDGKFTTGAYGHFTHESFETTKSTEYEAEAYVNYKEVGGIYAGIDKYAGSISMPYAGGNLYGKKAFDNGLSIAGALSAEFGYASINLEGYDEINILSADVTARGSLAFKAGEDISANVDAILKYENAHAVNSNNSPTQNMGAIVRSSFRKGKTEAYNLTCLYKDLNSESPLLTGAATFGIQINDFVKDGIAAYVEGTVCNTNANTNPNSSINGIKVGTRLNF